MKRSIRLIGFGFAVENIKIGVFICNYLHLAIAGLPGLLLTVADTGKFIHLVQYCIVFFTFVSTHTLVLPPTAIEVVICTQRDEYCKH